MKVFLKVKVFLESVESVSLLKLFLGVFKDESLIELLNSVKTRLKLLADKGHSFYYLHGRLQVRTVEPVTFSTT